MVLVRLDKFSGFLLIMAPGSSKHLSSSTGFNALRRGPAYFSFLRQAPDDSPASVPSGEVPPALRRASDDIHWLQRRALQQGRPPLAASTTFGCVPPVSNCTCRLRWISPSPVLSRHLLSALAGSWCLWRPPPLPDCIAPADSMASATVGCNGLWTFPVGLYVPPRLGSSSY